MQLFHREPENDVKEEDISKEEMANHFLALNKTLAKKFNRPTHFNSNKQIYRRKFNKKRHHNNNEGKDQPSTNKKFKKCSE